MEEKITYNDIYLAKWLAGELSDKELKKMVSDEDFLRYKKLQKGIDIYEQLEASLENTFAKIKAKINNTKTIKETQKPKGKVVSLFTKMVVSVAAIVLLFFSVNTFLVNKDVLFESNYGEHKTVALLDGSEVVLNAKSTLTYNKKDWKNNREVYLKGEAFFKVEKGSTFTVITDNGSVTVLGTQFNVNTQNNFFEVVCYEGKVQVISNNNKVLLTPNKSVRNINGNLSEETITLITNKPSWVLGESSFRSVPLQQVILALEKQFNIKIDTSNINKDILFTGTFDNKNLNVALASVFNSTNILYIVKGKTIILSK